MPADLASRCFPPLARPDARVLILGSLPGAASLRAYQYYAHPRNAFWKIMADLIGFSSASPYSERASALMDAGVAVWDVIAQGLRPGSLDADIDDASVKINDFNAFFAEHPRIHHVFFNGSKAYESYRRHVMPGLVAKNIACTRLPSTSPAHAGWSYAMKLEAWRVVQDALGL